MVVNNAFYPTLMWNGRFAALSADPLDNSLGFDSPPPEGLGGRRGLLFMHRRMIAMLHEAYRDNGKEPPAGWATIPGPVTPMGTVGMGTEAGMTTLKR